MQKCSLFVQLGKLLNSTKQLMTVVDMEKMIAAIMQRTGELLACEHCCLFVVEVSRLMPRRQCGSLLNADVIR